MSEHEHEEDQQKIKLDGSLGMGYHAQLTVYTKDEIHGEKEETFIFPYALIDHEMLQKFVTYKLVVGYKLITLPPKTEEV